MRISYKNSEILEKHFSKLINESIYNKYSKLLKPSQFIERSGLTSMIWVPKHYHVILILFGLSSRFFGNVLANSNL